MMYGLWDGSTAPWYGMIFGPILMIEPNAAPPPWLVALSLISSMSTASRAATNFIRESTLPRMTPSLASICWMVGSDSPAASTSWR